MKLWVDDTRPMPEGFDAIVHTYEQAIEILRTGQVTFISLDHDLGDQDTKTGYDIAKWIEKEAYYGRLPRLEWKVHSWSLVGQVNIERALRKADQYWDEREAK